MIKGSKSESNPATCYIAQGSVLGPLLFVTHIAELPNSVKTNAFLFADDNEIHKRIDSLYDHDIH